MVKGCLQLSILGFLVHCLCAWNLSSFHNIPTILSPLSVQSSISLMCNIQFSGMFSQTWFKLNVFQEVENANQILLMTNRFSISDVRNLNLTWPLHELGQRLSVQPHKSAMFGNHELQYKLSDKEKKPAVTHRVTSTVGKQESFLKTCPDDLLRPHPPPVAIFLILPSFFSLSSALAERRLHSAVTCSVSRNMMRACQRGDKQPVHTTCWVSTLAVILSNDAVVWKETWHNGPDEVLVWESVVTYVFWLLYSHSFVLLSHFVYRCYWACIVFEEAQVKAHLCLSYVCLIDDWWLEWACIIKAPCLSASYS